MAAPCDARAEVLSNTHLSPDYNVLVLAAPAIARAAMPGQFVMIRTTDGSDPLLRRPFSVFEILRDADGRPSALSVLCKRVGVGTTRLFQAAAGDTVDCLGPLGRPFTLVTPPAEAWMVAGGVGLAPFAALTERLRGADVGTTLFYGGRSQSDLFYLDWFAARGVRLELATEDGSRGTHGRITAPLDAALQHRHSPAPVMIYACGPEPMLKAVADLARRHGRRCEVSTERVMGCGMGGCYSCVVAILESDGRRHFVRSCLCGPVFDASQVVWE